MLLLTPDSVPEHGWCRNGSSLKCLTTESDDYSLRRNHMERDTEGEITGARAATLSKTRTVAARQLSGGYGQQDPERRDSGIFHALISSTYVHLPAAPFSRFYVYYPVHV